MLRSKAWCVNQTHLNYKIQMVKKQLAEFSESFLKQNKCYIPIHITGMDKLDGCTE